MVLLGGALALTGWVLDHEGLKSLGLRPPVTVKTNATLGLVAGGTALLLLAPIAAAGGRRVTGRVLAGFVLAVGAASLSEHVAGWDLGIDQLLYRETPGALATTRPNRMGPPASISFLLLGAGLFLLPAAGRAAMLVRQVAGTAVLLIALLPLIGYATGVSPLFGIARITGIALATALLLLMLAVGLLAARPAEGLAGLLCRPDEAGTLARRLIVPALVLPFVAAVALTRGVRAGWFDASYATAVMGLALIVSITGLIWKTAADISGALRARDAAEAARAGREEALRAANRRQTEFLAVLSHELRNPLAAIRYALELIGEPSPQPRSPRRVAERQLAHLVRLVDDLLDVTRIVTGKIQLRRRPVPLGEILARALESAEPAIGGSRHQLVVEPADEPVWLDADPERLTQVVTNLLHNAARYTPPAGVITVSVAPSPDAVVLRVADTGIGLRAEERERIFEMFAQGEGASGGLGVGLALVKTIAEMHGGAVEAHSEGHGRGCTFVLRLPRLREVPAITTDAAAAPAARDGRLRIVVADDNEDAAEMMRTLLELDGHVVRVATDGAAAVDLVTSFDPAVAVLDIGMPRLDGYEVARRVRAQGRPVCLIAVTGWGQDVDRQRARAAGFDAHLTKPASPDELRRLLAEIRTD
jgi:signal transduction histidine kinase/CheY-like chemotaxis protein